MRRPPAAFRSTKSRPSVVAGGWAVSNWSSTRTAGCADAASPSARRTRNDRVTPSARVGLPTASGSATPPRWRASRTYAQKAPGASSGSTVSQTGGRGALASAAQWAVSTVLPDPAGPLIRVSGPCAPAVSRPSSSGRWTSSFGTAGGANLAVSMGSPVGARWSMEVTGGPATVRTVIGPRSPLNR